MCLCMHRCDLGTAEHVGRGTETVGKNADPGNEDRANAYLGAETRND